MLNLIIILAMLLLICRIMLKEKNLNLKSKAPLILMVIGFLLTISIIHMYKDDSTLYLYMIITCIIGFIFGLIRGTTMKISFNSRTQEWLKKGSPLTIIIFILGIIINIGIAKFFFPSYVTGLDSIMTTLHIGITLYAAKFILRMKVTSFQ
ncbi:hypothetical protein N9R04_09700 [Staphylococcus sp. SQ8-PEA]|uniref:DUF1453 domain-containing protein n=1 Tax=Staphylococcus marylandisciuri TaxID=2981529 RepID=A0ABT2QSH1_9STAP|nr:hypothetical protein [Staphylococcus marylandisciuri]